MGNDPFDNTTVYYLLKDSASMYCLRDTKSKAVKPLVSQCIILGFPPLGEIRNLRGDWVKAFMLHCQTNCFVNHLQLHHFLVMHRYHFY